MKYKRERERERERERARERERELVHRGLGGEIWFSNLSHGG